MTAETDVPLSAVEKTAATRRSWSVLADCSTPRRCHRKGAVAKSYPTSWRHQLLLAVTI